MAEQFTNEYWKDIMYTNGLVDREHYDMHHNIYRFGIIAPHEIIRDGREYLFFTKPDLHIMDGKKGKLNKELEEGRNDCTADYLIWYKTFDEIKNKNLLELDNLQLQIADFQSKQHAINAKIQQERLSAEKSKRFCILLSDESLQDINLLLNLRTQFFKKDTLSKIVWSEYIQPAFKEMLKRQFGATIPKNVIYCIENLDTNEKYIGKTSQEVGKRCSDHIKSSLSIGTNSNSLFHQALYKNWDNFKFTVLEEVNTNALTEREKFYISLYQTDIYGYNMKVG